MGSRIGALELCLEMKFTTQQCNSYYCTVLDMNDFTIFTNTPLSQAHTAWLNQL